jgi:hypothetical protein
MPTSDGKKIAFALGGLAGSNAHGVGFLAAAHECAVTPDIISCTSGMIYWVWRYLVDPRNFADEFIDAIERAAPYPFRWQNLWHLAAFGVPGVFRPAGLEWWARMLKPLTHFVPSDELADQLMARLWPAQTAVPTRSHAEFEEIAETLRSSKIAIFFNSFAPREGCEYLYMNKEARLLYEAQQDKKAHLRAISDAAAERLRDHLPRIVPKDIDAKAVEDALWLTLYGFGGRRAGEHCRIDGAYARQFILNELSDAKILFMARPQAYHFEGRAPHSVFEVRDLETNLWFNGAYAQQLRTIDLINRLVRNKAFVPAVAAKFHEIELVPIEIEVDRGFFCYFIEDPKVFQTARDRSRDVFQGMALCGNAQARLPDAADD